MAENQAVDTNATPQQAEPQGNATAASTPAEPQGTAASETDWKAEARKWEERAKANKAAVDELDKIKESQMTDLQKAQKRAEEAERKAQAIEAKQQRAASVKEAAKIAVVDEDILSMMAGDTPEEIAANAATLKAKISAMPVYPNVPDSGASSTPTMTKEEIDKIKDPAKRVMERAKHIDLYK